MKEKALKALLVIIIGLAAFTAGNLLSKQLYPKPVEKPADNRYGAIVRLVQDDHTFCTGTVVSKGLIITAAHCVLTETPFGMMLRSDSIEIRPSENVKLFTTGRVVYASPQMDQAMLTGEFFQYKTIPFITDPAILEKSRRKLTPFVSCGYPLNGKLYCTHTSFKEPSAFFWRLNGVLIPGMSGGPTIDENGNLVAVNVAVEGTDAIVSPIINITSSLPRVK